MQLNKQAVQLFGKLRSCSPERLSLSERHQETSCLNSYPRKWELRQWFNKKNLNRRINICSTVHLDAWTEWPADCIVHTLLKSCNKSTLHFLATWTFVNCAFPLISIPKEKMKLVLLFHLMKWKIDNLSDSATATNRQNNQFVTQILSVRPYTDYLCLTF